MIPHIVHRIWIGGPEPEWTRPFRHTWEVGDWKVWQWGEDEIEKIMPLRNQQLYEDASIYAKGHEGQFRSDLLRYEILHQFGGMYVDHDMELIKPIDGLLEDTDCVAAWEVQDEWIANGFMGCTPGHPFLDGLIEGLPPRVTALQGRKFRPNRITGPHYLTSKYRQWKGFRIKVMPQNLIYPYGWSEIRECNPGDDFGYDVYTAHHWHNMRKMKNVPVH